MADTIIGSDYAAALVKLDTIGQIGWVVPIARPGMNVFSSALVITSDSGYAMWMDVESGFPPNISSWNMCTRFSPERLDILPRPSATLVDLRLDQNYPNPFNSTTTLNLTLPKSGPVEILLFDLIGRTTRVIDQSDYRAGEHRVVIDAAGLPSGTYFVEARTSFETVARKIVLLR